MRRLLSFLALASASLPALAACPANTPGEPLHWAIAICQQRYETDEIESPKMQSCIFSTAKAHQVDPAKPSANACAINLQLKKKWCAGLKKPARPTRRTPASARATRSPKRWRKAAPERQDGPRRAAGISCRFAQSAAPCLRPRTNTGRIP
ncbi:hypothetical protein [Chromobacterium vaccinii]|uniref:hypothetical protein n=1 Tax=Chromobacterium vaccinii TaxID=1108595 RepID=UPI0011C020FE|nr:hypothetical protein [Chromobacterium vaccinii]